ncbi:hypothetical protein GALMADRAFT_242704 [Galerina marginata CBS 339.88]|uniref:Brain protein I3 n=1 Tax=Galerina marginata (strain CBS 339.88) TaxID=685588 RepID=A0A067TK86_GALM3|nr:hypothetical protein GALMADRAFT_242704 [Galerina marginata CBS 339.88]
MEAAQNNAATVADANPPAYPMPPTAPFPGQQQQYSMQPAPMPMAPVAQVGQPMGAPPMDPAMAAAIAGQQYRDQLFAQCAMGNHERVTEYGVLGIITAVVCFPCGLICLFADTKHKCQRCGVSMV